MSSSVHRHPELGPGKVVEVGDGVFAYIQPDGSWYINNTGFVVGDAAVISIDSCATERRTRALRAAISEVTALPVTTLVNTHHHGDHSYGNSVLGAPVIVGHAATRAAVLDAGLPANTGFWDPVGWGELELAPPNVTFEDQLCLWPDDRPVQVRYVGQPAHTGDDCIVWLPEQRVLFAGDLLFNGGTPFVLMGSVTGALDVLQSVVAPIPAETIVPGHGAPATRELVATVVGYLRFVLDEARQGLAAGLSPLETARELDLGIYTEWSDRERVVGNLHRAYADLDPEHHRVDLVEALTDMVAYNGGRPLSCYA
jgi:cyclase